MNPKETVKVLEELQNKILLFFSYNNGKEKFYNALNHTIHCCKMVEIKENKIYKVLKKELWDYYYELNDFSNQKEAIENAENDLRNLAQAIYRELKGIKE